jgi:hypothetical protein
MLDNGFPASWATAGLKAPIVRFRNRDRAQPIARNQAAVVAIFEVQPARNDNSRETALEEIRPGKSASRQLDLYQPLLACGAAQGSLRPQSALSTTQELRKQPVSAPSR